MKAPHCLGLGDLERERERDIYIYILESSGYVVEVEVHNWVDVNFALINLSLD